MLKKTILSAGLIAAAGMLAGTGASNASIQTFAVTNFNAGDTSNPLNASVTFTPNSNGELSVQIFNTSDTLSDSEGVFGVTFELYNGATQLQTTAPSVGGGAVGDIWTVTSSTTGHGPPSYTATLSSSAYTNSALTNSWVTSANSGVYSLNVGTGKPHDLVIGTTSDINSSVSEHSPSLASGAIFTLTGITGLGASTTISNVDVIYGTDNLDTGPLGQITAIPTGQPLPIPATLPLVGGGLLGLGLIALRKRRRLSQIR